MLPAEGHRLSHSKRLTLPPVLWLTAGRAPHRARGERLCAEAQNGPPTDLPSREVWRRAPRDRDVGVCGEARAPARPRSPCHAARLGSPTILMLGSPWCKPAGDPHLPVRSLQQHTRPAPRRSTRPEVPSRAPAQGCSLRYSSLSASSAAPSHCRAGLLAPTPKPSETWPLVRPPASGAPGMEAPGWPPRHLGLISRMLPAPRVLTARAACLHPPAGAEVVVDVMSEHMGSTELDSQSLINTRVTGVPRESLSALLDAMVCRV